MPDLAKLSIEVDSSQVVQANKTLASMESASNKAESAVVELGKEFEKTGEKIKRKRKSAKDATQAVDELGNASESTGRKSKKAAGDLDATSKKILKIAEDAAVAQKKLDAFRVGVPTDMKGLQSASNVGFDSILKNAQRLADEQQKIMSSSIQKSFEGLQQKITPPDLKSLIEQENKLAASSSTTTNALKAMIAAENKLAAQSATTSNALKAQESVTQKTASQTKKFTDEVVTLSKVQSTLGGLVRNLALGFGAIIGAQTIGQVIQLTDSYNALQSRIKDATRFTGDYVAVSRELSRISKQTGTTLEDNVSVFQRLANSVTSLGKSNQDALQLSETIQKLGAISGASNTALSAGLLQFGQAMSAGVVRAEEFNSIVENLPAVADALARGLGKSPGELRKMVLEGKLLSRDVFDALLKQQAEIDKRFAALPPTIARASNALRISFVELTSQIDQSLGITSSFASALQSIANAADILSSNNGAAVLSFIDLIKQVTFLGVELTKLIIPIDAVFEAINSLASLIGLVLPKNMKQAAQGAIGMASQIDTLTTVIKNARVDIDALGKSALSLGQTFIDGLTGSDKKAVEDFFKRQTEISQKALQEKARNDLSLTQRNFERLRKIAELEGVKFSGGVSQKTSRPAPIVDTSKADKALQNRRETFIRNLEIETQKTKELYKAQLQGGESARLLTIQIEAMAQVRAANLQLSDKEEKSLAARIAKNKLLEESTRRIASAQDEIQRIIFENKGIDIMTAAFRTAGNEAKTTAANMLKVKMALDSIFGQAGPRSKRELELFNQLKTLLESNVEKSQDAAYRKEETAQKRSIENDRRLLEARKQGLDTLRQVQDQIELESQVLGANLDINGELGSKMLDRLKTAQSLRREAELLAGTQERQFQIETLQQQLGARGVGFNPTTGNLELTQLQEISRERQRLLEIRNQGLNLSSQEGQALYAQLKTIDDLTLSLERQTAQQQQVVDLANQMKSAFADAFVSAVTGAKSFKTAMIDLLNTLSQMILRQSVERGISALFSMAFGGSPAGTQQLGGYLGQTTPFLAGIGPRFASGGITSGPEMFPMSNGRTGLRGESGPEAILPLQRLPGGDLGVRALSGSAGSSAPIVNNVNVTVNGNGGSEEENKDLSDKIATSVIQALIDDRIVFNQRPGGLLNQGSLT
ncbi:MAG: tape measure protein [Smithella sp.]